MTNDELLFFDAMPQMLPVYQKLCEELEARGLVFARKVTKTQISLRNRHVFAAVSLPWRKVKGWPMEYLLLSFGLPSRRESPRIAVSTEPYPNRWTHHVLLTCPDEVDNTILDWVNEAYEFALAK